MKNIFKHSFAWHVCSYLIPIITLVFCVIMVWYYNVSRDKIIAETMSKIDTTLANMSLKIENNLQSVSKSLDYTKWNVEKNLSNEDRVREIMTHILKNNPLIMGCGVAYESQSEESNENLHMIYGLKSGKALNFKIIGGNQYYYPGMDWYLIPKRLKRPYWSEPYFDEGGGNQVMTTYSLPLFDKSGKVCGVIGADIALFNFTDIVEKMKMFNDSYTFLLSRNGYYLTHKNKSRIMHETIFSDALGQKNKQYEQVGKEMLAGHAGNRKITLNGKVCYAIYAPIRSNGWSICNVCSEDAPLRVLNGVTQTLIDIFIVGIILFLIFSIFIIKRMMKPLEGFATSVEEVAKGNFNVKLPEIKSHDEIKELYDSFTYMQTSLETYISELKETTATKERIQNELKIAHEIQMGMIPKIFPPFPERDDIDIHAVLKPAKEVGGDLYDFFIVDEKLYFVIGDVSGKGIPASLFMAVTRSLFRTISGNSSSPKEIITRMNDSITDQNESNMFVTLFMGIFDLATGVLKFCNAGHNPPVLVQSKGNVAYMEVKKNLPVGLIKGFSYESETTTLATGDKLFCYTDGVVEAESVTHELFSEQRLLVTLETNYKCPVKELTEHVMNSIAEHVKQAEPSDDLTILIINYKK